MGPGFLHTTLWHTFRYESFRCLSFWTASCMGYYKGYYLCKIGLRFIAQDA